MVNQPHRSQTRTRYGGRRTGRPNPTLNDRALKLHPQTIHTEISQTEDITVPATAISRILRLLLPPGIGPAPLPARPYTILVDPQSRATMFLGLNNLSLRLRRPRCLKPIPVCRLDHNPKHLIPEFMLINALLPPRHHNLLMNAFPALMNTLRYLAPTLTREVDLPRQSLKQFPPPRYGFPQRNLHQCLGSIGTETERRRRKNQGIGTRKGPGRAPTGVQSER